MAKPYSSADIVALKGCEAIRRRPGMYIGDTTARGLHQLVWELVGNAAYEGIAMPRVRIEVALDRDGSASVADDGPGIGVLASANRGRESKVQSLLTELRACHRSRTPFGIGLPVVGALSEFLVLETRVGGKTYVMRVERGEVVSPLRCVGEAAASGTRITFKPDAEIFGEVSLGMPAILRICRERARVQENVQFVVTDRTPTMPTETNIVCRAGLREVVGELGLGLRVFPEAGFHVAAEYPIVDLTKPVVLSSAVAFTRRSFARISSFVNFTASAHGGTHAQGFKAAMDGAFELARVPRGDRAALRRGMIGAVHVFHPSPRWEGCTRSQVSSPELEEVVREALMPGMARWMEENLVEIVGERVMAGV